MKKIIKITQADSAPFHLSWVINNICTNKCSYCPSDLHAGTNHNYEWENAKVFFKELFRRYPKIHCSVSGGEPSVSPFFPEICKILYEAGHTIGVTSNAAKPVAYWADISKYLNYICFSYHAEFPDKNFIEKIDAASQNTFVTARIMMHSKKWDQCLAVYEALMEKNTCFVEPVRMLNWGGVNASTESYDYTPEQLAWFNTHTGNHSTLVLTQFADRPKLELFADFTLEDGSVDVHGNAVEYINRGLTNFKGFVCQAGLKGLFIDWLGDVHLANCCIGGPIGNINVPKYIGWPNSPVICDKDLCHCASDVNLNKWIMK